VKQGNSWLHCGEIVDANRWVRLTNGSAVTHNMTGVSRAWSKHASANLSKVLDRGGYRKSWATSISVTEKYVPGIL